MFSVGVSANEYLVAFERAFANVPYENNREAVVHFSHSAFHTHAHFFSLALYAGYVLALYRLLNFGEKFLLASSRVHNHRIPSVYDSGFLQPDKVWVALKKGHRNILRNLC